MLPKEEKSRLHFETRQINAVQYFAVIKIFQTQRCLSELYARDLKWQNQLAKDCISKFSSTAEGEFLLIEAFQPFLL